MIYSFSTFFIAIVFHKAVKKSATRPSTLSRPCDVCTVPRDLGGQRGASEWAPPQLLTCQSALCRSTIEAIPLRTFVPAFAIDRLRLSRAFRHTANGLKLNVVRT